MWRVKNNGEKEGGFIYLKIPIYVDVMFYII